MNIKEILESNNLAEDLPEDRLNEIADSVIQRYNDDLQSRAYKQSTLTDIVKLALSISEEKSYPWEGAANVVFPLISTAVIEFGAKCSPEILRDDFIVKAKIIGKDEGRIQYNMAGAPMIGEDGQPLKQGVGEKEKKGERVSTYMNYLLSNKIENWAEDTDKLLISLAATGMMFRKTYQSGKDVCSEIIFPDKLIVHDKVTNFNKAPITHVIELYKNEIQEKVRKGIFKEFDFGESDSEVIQNDLSNVQDGSRTSVNSGLFVFLEQCCWLDLDDDDFLEPYVVTIHQSSNQIVRIVPRFSQKDVEKKGDRIISIKAENPYTPYSFIPSPDGSFYGIGLGHLLFNLNKSINTSINQLTDAGTLQNTGGGFIAKSLKIKGGEYKMKPNEYKMVDSFGGSIRDSIVPLPTPQPSQTLFALLGFLTQSGKELGSLRDVLTGENAANVQATTMMAMVEQGITQFKSIYKRIYRSLKSEFKIIHNIIPRVTSNEQYAKVLDEPVLDVSVKLDFESQSFDIVPVADVSSVTNTQRMAKAAFLMQFLQDPYVDPMEIRRRIMISYNIEGYDKLIVQPAPAGPTMEEILSQAELMKADNKLKEIEIQAVSTANSIEKTKFDNEKTLAEIQKLESESLKSISEAFAKERESILKIADSIREEIKQRAEAQTITLPNEKNIEMVQTEESESV